MTATIIQGKAVGSPLEPQGTGRPNRILMKDYASGEGMFRVETDVLLDPKEFDDLQAWLEEPAHADTSRKIVTWLHNKVEQTNSDRQGKDNAKKMFSAGFGLLP